MLASLLPAKIPSRPACPTPAILANVSFWLKTYVLIAIFYLMVCSLLRPNIKRIQIRALGIIINSHILQSLLNPYHLLKNILYVYKINNLHPVNSWKQSGLLKFYKFSFFVFLSFFLKSAKFKNASSRLVYFNENLAFNYSRF